LLDRFAMKTHAAADLTGCTDWKFFLCTDAIPTDSNIPSWIQQTFYYNSSEIFFHIKYQWCLEQIPGDTVVTGQQDDNFLQGDVNWHSLAQAASVVQNRSNPVNVVYLGLSGFNYLAMKWVPALEYGPNMWKDHNHYALVPGIWNRTALADIYKRISDCVVFRSNPRRFGSPLGAEWVVERDVCMPKKPLISSLTGFFNASLGKQLGGEMNSPSWQPEVSTAWKVVNGLLQGRVDAYRKPELCCLFEYYIKKSHDNTAFSDCNQLKPQTGRFRVSLRLGTPKDLVREFPECFIL